jgi:branched-chain amino acid transport system permease protein
MVARAEALAKPLVIPTLLKQSIGAALIALVLTSLIVGIKTVDTNEALSFTTRFPSVAWASIGVGLAYLGFGLVRSGMPLAALIASLAVGVAQASVLLWGGPAKELYLPFEDPVVNWVVVLVAGVIAIRAALALRRGDGTGAAPAGTALGDRIARKFNQASRLLAPLLIAFAITMPFLPFADRRFVDVATLVSTYVMLGWGLNIVVGLAGLLDLGYVAFYAVGAYSYSMFATYLGLSFWLCLPLAGLIAASFGVLLGFPVLRLRGDYLAIVTLGFGEMVRLILINWWWFTGGPNGINNVPRPSFFGIPFERNPPEGTWSFHKLFGIEYSSNHRVVFLYYLILGLALLTCLFSYRIRRLPIGRAWEALREDETACRALGINPTNTKLTAFAIGAMFGGFAGSFFATRQGFVSPESFTFLESAVILAIVVLGGMGSQVGVALAAIVLIGVPEFFRELAGYRMLAFGIGMVLIMIWRPRGLLAVRDPTIRLHPRGGPEPEPVKP